MGDTLVSGKGCLSQMSLSHMHHIGVLISLLAFGDTDRRQQWRAERFQGVTISEVKLLLLIKMSRVVGKK